MGYELEQEKYKLSSQSVDYQTTLKLEWKIHTMLNRASEIAKETRIKLGEEHRCHTFDIQCDCEMPDFQKELHPAHCFNKYLMEQRIRYGGSK